MKKFIVLTIALVLMSSSAYAALSGSGHAFSFAGGDLCGPCHTPHNGDNTIAPLWSHDPTAQVFTRSDATTFTPTGVSNACLSCHDGVTNMSAYVNSVSAAAYMATTSVGYIGTDLADDHPINVVYTPGAGYDTVLNAVADGVQFEGVAGSETVECSSCHDVHNGGETTSGNMLRFANTNSALCVACHIK